MLFLQESYINRTEGYRFGDSDVYETWTDDPGKLYRSLMREYGRCIGKVYTDESDGRTLAIGWVFVKRTKYTDSPDTYLQETWCTLHTAKPTRTTKYHYRALN